MFKIYGTIFALAFGLGVNAQNDLDALRYSRLANTGSSRYMAMGGAFGALGADISCASANPAGLGLFKKGDIILGAGLKFTHDKGIINGQKTTVPDARFVFNTLGMSTAWNSKSYPENRNVIAFSNTQIQNFSNKIRMSTYTNSTSIVKDMMNQIGDGTRPVDLNFAYEGGAYNVWLIDQDTVTKKYFSFVDLKRTVFQSREINTTGRVNELNFSYAYSHKDRFYIGASVGVPKVTFTSTTTHSEVDDKDSMRITITNTTSPMTFTSTYIDALPAAYSDKLGFNSLVYTEYFSTQGSGLNLKLGAVARLSDLIRLGFYYHTPTLYTFRDVYKNIVKASFDKDPKSFEENVFPGENAGYFDYKVITPAKYAASVGIIIKKYAAIGLDYELTDYRTASLTSDNSSDFVGVNAVIKNKYTLGHNVKIGVEANVKPLMIRAGYNMQGSPFGEVFIGNFVRHTFSLGFGFRTKNNFFVDVCWFKYLSKEDYYMFSSIPQKSNLVYDNSMLSTSVGFKF